MTDPTPRDVFVSHSSKDARVAALVVSAFEEKGITCWVAPRDIPGGSSWPLSIPPAIKACRCFLLIFSGNSDASDFVMKEITLAANWRKPIIPFRVEDINPECLALFLADTQWIVASNPLNQADLDKLCEAVAGILNSLREHGGCLPGIHSTERRPGAIRTLDLGNGVSMNLCWCPPGMFLMGSPESELGRSNGEGPQHEVTITRGFWLGQTPVTQAQWQAVMGKNPSFQGSDHPVERVSWYGCSDFLRKLSLAQDETLRLPTEAEWEYACRAGTTTAWFFGSVARNLTEYAWFDANSDGETQPVGQMKPNPWGLFDVYGNVWEWCEDLYGPYSSGALTDPRGTTSVGNPVLRGGSYWNPPHICRSAYRDCLDPTSISIDTGFRVLLAAQ